MKRHEFPNNWPIPDEYLLELGRMTVIWGSLETNVNLAISKFAGYEAVLDHRAVILVAHSNFQQRVHIIGALCESLEPSYPSLKDYKAVISKLGAAQSIRNKYAHNSMYKNDETGAIETSYATARGTLKLHLENVELRDLKEATAKIHEAACALYQLVTGKEMKPLWER
jgi:hypothetical protein